MSLLRLLRRVSSLGAVLLAACDLGPSGPGTVGGTLTGNASLGAAVLDVTWPGVLGFEGQGSTQVYWAPVDGFPDRYRVILVNPTGGDIPFAIEEADVLLRSPTITFVEAAGTDNQPLAVEGLRVTLVR
ncbi:MAG: hypothetical protein FJ207_10945 [Gemmatimonadetes bacterium]|nr:hypothetical protein [Gemmatimonadota bacterium]